MYCLNCLLQMLSTLLIWLYIAYVSVSIGLIIFRLCIWFFKIEKEVLALEIISFIGLAFLTSILGYISLVSPIGLLIHVIIILCCGISLFICRKDFIYSIKDFGLLFAGKAFLAFSLSMCVLVIIQSVKHPFWIDIGGYHAQSIQWIEKFGVVKGLANLHDRFGFNNASHLASAFFNVSFVASPIYHAVSSYMIIAFFIWSFRIILTSVQTSQGIKFGLTLSVLLLLIYYRDWISSPTPDMVCTIYLLLTGFLFLLGMEKNEDTKTLRIDFFVVTILGVSAVAVKVSAIPISVLIAVYIFTNRQLLNLRSFLGLAIIAIVLELPILVRNYYLSGYLLFPFHQLDIFNPDWKIPKIYSEEVSNLIFNFARGLGGSTSKIHNLTYKDWLLKWFMGLETYNKAILATIITAPLWVFLSVFKGKTYPNHGFNKWIFLTGSMFICLIFWFFQAPSFRFAHGFIILCFVGIVMLILQLTSLPIHLTKKLTAGSGIVLLLFTLYSIARETPELDIQKNSYLYFIPTPYREEHVIMVPVPYNQEIKSPDTCRECWNLPLPCSPNVLPTVEFRGTTLENGFRMKKNP